MRLDKPIKLKDILETDNILDLLTNQDKMTVAGQVSEGYTEDKQSMRKWSGKTKKYLKFANCDVQDRTVPWPGASNLCIPLIANSCIASASRLYAELLRNKYPAETYIYGQHDTDIPQEQQQGLMDLSQNMKDHILYQLRVDEGCNWADDLYTLCYLYYVTGTVPRFKYYDEAAKCYKFKTLWPDQWAISANAEDLDNSRFSFCDKMYIVEIMDKVNSGEYSEYKYLEDLDPEAVDLYEKRNIVTQMVKFDLDNDGYAEPYCVVVDLDANEVLKMSKNFYTEETQEIDEEGNASIQSSQLDYDDNGELVGVKELTAIPYVTMYRMQDADKGEYLKYGLAHRLYPINRAMNALTNQVLDIGTLQSRQGAFIDQRARLRGGTNSLSMNQSMFVKPPPGLTLTQAIMSFPRSEISPVQYQMLEFLKGLGDETGNVTEIMSGQVPDNTSPMIGMAAIQNSLLPFKTTYRLFLTAYNREISSMGIMNYIYLGDEETFFLNDRQIGVSRQMYNPKVSKIIPIADPTISAESERMYQQSILDSVIDRPESNDREILMRKLEVSNIDNPERYLPPPNPEPPPSPEIEQMKATIMALEQQVNQQWEQIKIKQQQLDLNNKELDHKISKERLELALKADKEMSEQMERSAAAIKDIADAEAAEAGSQLAQYQAVQQNLMEQGNVSRGRDEQPRGRIEPIGEEIAGGDLGMEGEQDNGLDDALPGDLE